MSIEPIDYLELTREALRGVMAKAMAHAAEHGLGDDQHFLVQFSTTHPGVVMPDWLRAQYPEEIAIVLQHEFSDLAVMNDRFSVALSFNNRPCTLVAPFAAVRTFADPSVNFQLDIPVNDSAGMSISEDIEDADDMPEDDAGRSEAADNDAEAEKAEGTVVSLDAFRKK